MTETVFLTNIPIVVLIIFIFGLLMVFLEVHYNTKGVLGILGGLAEVITLILCYITGVPVIEQLALFLTGCLIISYIINFRAPDKGEICSLIR